MKLKKITQEELKEILEKHQKWLNDEEGGEQADLRWSDLSGADLSSANLKGADLIGADLIGANLSGANLDYSCFPLWCGSLDVHIDERQAVQLLYHLLRNVSYSKNVSEDMKQKLLTPELVELANRFHRAKECGEIMPYKE